VKRFWALLFLVLLTSCRSGPEKCRTAKALLEDNFNDEACGWDRYDREEASAGYADTEYFIAVHQPNTSAVAVPGAQFTDVSIETDVRLGGGLADNNLGILCRYQDMDHFYAFLISTNGQQLASVTDDQLTAGDIGFIVSTYSEGSTEVRFDNLFVREPVAPLGESE
jgi:hypothetical protein